MVPMHCKGDRYGQGRGDLPTDALGPLSHPPSAGAGSVESAESKPAPRDGRQGGRCVKDRQMHEPGPAVPEGARQGSEARLRDWSWVEASVWTPRMLEALGNGVQGGKWFSLIDKVSRLTTLQAAWEKVKANKGAAGVDGQGVAAFGQQAPRHLQELQEALKAGTYRPAPLK